MNDPGPAPDPADEEAASALDTVAQALDALDADDLDLADSLADGVAAEVAPSDGPEHSEGAAEDAPAAPTDAADTGGYDATGPHDDPSSATD